MKYKNTVSNSGLFTAALVVAFTFSMQAKASAAQDGEADGEGGVEAQSPMLQDRPLVIASSRSRTDDATLLARLDEWQIEYDWQPASDDLSGVDLYIAANTAQDRLWPVLYQHTRVNTEATGLIQPVRYGDITVFLTLPVGYRSPVLVSDPLAVSTAGSVQLQPCITESGVVLENWNALNAGNPDAFASETSHTAGSDMSGLEALANLECGSAIVSNATIESVGRASNKVLEAASARWQVQSYQGKEGEALKIPVLAGALSARAYYVLNALSQNEAGVDN